MSEPRRVYLDTNIFIVLREHHGPESEQLVALAQASSQTGRARLVTSELTLAELLVKPMADGESDLARDYEQMIGGADWLTVLPVGRDVLRRAASLRSRHRGLKLPDAIHIGSALAGACSRVLTSDTGIKDTQLVRAEGTAPLTLVRPDLPSLIALARWIAE
ncbi:MAG: PIN domain-containing protein [Devosia nanyangense]|uniref:PIN domain-containing protein n=1 Tax=Devosia nanyangense TaxID=1228055 RepID=A0A933NXQ1_9HYPH|nr:PIN domain-containing protein [Devosia nanyangense]